MSTWTFTCSISRRFGARTVKTITIVRSASMPTTGRTTDGGPLSFCTVARCALSGKSTTLSARIQKGARISTSVCILTDGRNRSTIRTSSKWSLANTLRAARSLTVLTTTASMIDSCPWLSGSGSFRKRALLLSSRTSIWRATVLNRALWLTNRLASLACLL